MVEIPLRVDKLFQKTYFQFEEGREILSSLQMFGNEDQQNDDKKKEEEEEAGPSSSRNPNAEDRKAKRNLRFQIPVAEIRSEESFTSALSFTLGDENNDDYEDFTPQDKETFSVLKKYIHTPLRHSSPRSASLMPCYLQCDEEEVNFFLSSSSSKQLFEILRHSPTPSDADINLISATYLRKLAEVKEAIGNGADVNTFRDRQTPLLIATEIGDTRLVAYLLTVPNVNPDFQNDFGQTPLIVAVRNAFDKIVRLLLNYNADVNISDNMGKTPLHSALFQQRPALAKLLLAYGADCEKQDCFGERPMYTSAVKKPHLECLLTLLKMGASPEYRNVTGIPLLSRAILNGTDFHIIRTLVEYGANINSQESVSRKTPLHFAALTNNIRVARLLVDKNADLNIKTTYNFNPIEEAYFHGSVDVLEYLSDKSQYDKMIFHSPSTAQNSIQSSVQSTTETRRSSPVNKKTSFITKKPSQKKPKKK